MMTTKQNSAQTGQTQEALERAEEQRILEEISGADGKSAEFSHSAKIAQKLEKGELDLTRDERIKLRDTLKDKNKMKEKPYEHFMEALADGKFPKKGKHAMRFLSAIEGDEEKKILSGKKEKEYAAELLKDLAKAENPPLSERSEKSSLETLDSLRKEEQKEVRKSEKEGEKKAKETHKKVEITSQVQEKELWEIDRPPEGLLENLEARELKMYELMDKKTERIKKGEKTEDLDAKIERLEFERTPYRQQYLDYYRKTVERYEGLQKLERATGMDMEIISNLLKGGSFETSEGTIKIKAFNFEDKDDVSAEFSGTLIVEYTNEQGREVTSDFTEFLKLMKPRTVHKKIQTIADLNKELAKNTRDGEVKKGQTYVADVLVGLGKNGEEIREERRFTIEEIDLSGKEPVIVLDQGVTETKQKEFSFGEFAKVVKQNRYAEEIKEGDMQAIVDRMARARRERDIAMNEQVALNLTGKPATEISKKRFESTFAAPVATSGSVKIPKLGESEPIEFYDDEAGGRRVLDAQLTVKPDPKNPNQNIFEISYKETAENATNLTCLAELTDEHKRAIGPTFLPEPRKIVRRYTPASFLELADKSAVLNGHHAEEAQEMEQKPTSQSKPQEGEKGKTSDGAEEKKNKGYHDAVPNEEAYKTGLPSHGPSQSFAKAVWNNTRFLSLDDLWKMGKTCYEYYERRFEQRQKNRYGIVGKELPFFGSEMQQISQAANNEQTSHFKEALEKKGILTIRERLRVTSNKEEFKACIIVLTEKGMMVWHDTAFWKNLNKFVKPGKEVPLPKPPNQNNPYTHISETDDRTGYEFLEGAIDSCWGDGYWGDWYSGNKNHYDSHAKNFSAKGEELEGIEGGHHRHLKHLLHNHKEGHFVDPMEYEGVLLHAIDAGKAMMQDKIYYIVQGIVAQNPNGETILTLDRMAHINSKYLGKFPILEYMCAKVARPPNGEIKSRFTLADYQRWGHWFDTVKGSYNSKNCEPTEAVDDFMWEFAIPSDDTQNRINKVARSIENLDHDDLFAYIPPATEDVLKDMCKTNIGGRKGATIEGYANVFPGFSQYMRSLSGHGQKNKLAEAVKSYVLFEGIMTNKFEKQADSAHDVYQRMGDSTLNSKTIVSDETPQQFITQLNAMIKDIGHAYVGAPGGDDLNSLISEIFDVHVGDMSNPDEKRKQDRKNYAYQKFGKVFSSVIQSDKGEKMQHVIDSSKLFGMPYLSSEEKERRKAESKNNLSLD